MSPRSSHLRRAADLVVRVALPLGVFGAVLAVLLGELASIDHEVQLVVPSAARPGEPIPAQAIVFAEGAEGELPERASVPVRVVVRQGDREVARTELAPSPAGGAAGEVAPLPAGTYRVRGTALVDGEGVASAETSLTVRADAPSATSGPRASRPVQRLALGPVFDAEGRLAPRPFEVRVAGSACVPEHPCSLLVHVGAPGASVRAIGSPAVTPLEEDLGEETEGLVAIPVVVHGPDAEVELEATRGGEVVGRREVQLPIAMAAPALSIAEPFPRGDEVAAEVRGESALRFAIVDVYREGRWIRTLHGAPGDDPRAVSFAVALPPGGGAIRLQARIDPWDARHATVRHVAGGVTDALLADAPPGPTALRFAWAMAPDEAELFALPEAVSGREADEARIAARQATLRTAALVAILLGIAVLALVFVRRGVDAALEAARVMGETGDPALTGERYRRRTMLEALAIVACVLVAFVGAAAMVIVRARLFD